MVRIWNETIVIAMKIHLLLKVRNLSLARSLTIKQPLIYL